jgi:hypothetical protein
MEALYLYGFSWRNGTGSLSMSVTFVSKWKIAAMM